MSTFATSLPINACANPVPNPLPYDIADDKRRNQVMKLLESLGTRMNYSVFECMLTDLQYSLMCKKLEKIVVRREDWVNIYPLCTECFARIEYIPPVKKKEPPIIAVI
jgi:CRISPR-associated protein Cas2